MSWLYDTFVLPFTFPVMRDALLMALAVGLEYLVAQAWFGAGARQAA